MNVIEILKNALNDMVSKGEIDELDDTALYHLGQNFSSYLLVKKHWPKDYLFLKKYFHEIDFKFKYDFENLETFELSDDTWEFIGFDDGYEGHRLIFKSEDGKLKLTNHTEVGEDECNQYGIQSNVIKALLNN